MDAVVCRRVGSLKPSDPPSEKDAILAFERNFPVPSLHRPPSSSSVLIRVAAASLNFADALQIMGQYQERPPVPFVPGAEVAGVVEEVGEGVGGFKRGDRVCAVVEGGGFADLAVADEGSCFHTYPYRSALPSSNSTPSLSHLALTQRARVGRGHVVLVLGAGGGTRANLLFSPKPTAPPPHSPPFPTSCPSRTSCLLSFAFRPFSPFPSSFHIPPTVPFPAAAALPVAFGTAHLALTQRAHVGREHVVLVLGAGGGVGVAAVQICKLLGATVIAVARGAEKASLLASLGADLVIDTAQHTHPNAIRDQTNQFLKQRSQERSAGGPGGRPGGGAGDKGGKGGRGSGGVDVLFDTVGGEQFKQGLRVMRWGGHVLVIGFASGAIPSIPANIALVKNLTIHGVYWGSYMQHDPAVLRASMHQLLAWLAKGAISVHVSHSFTFNQVHQAIVTLLKRKAVGKVVLLPPSAASAAGDSATAGAGTGSSGHTSRL
ncbi:unnamed protein product [Closterium sp. NIES-64]|nr:unnamed protein product [Closterium sp. NIES-64]